MIENINFKCYNCGKCFRDNANLMKHKNRKTPCLIREIAAENIQNPLRCIYCNKILSKKEHLTRHHRTCKIKNGGMEMLADKVRYEQEIRILKEQREIDKNNVDMLQLREQQMRKEMDEIKAQMKALALANVVNNTINNTTNNTTNNTNNNTIHITLNSYLRPRTDHLAITQDDMLAMNITRMLIQKIYFDKTAPENHTLYLPNKNKRELMVHDADWKLVTGEDVDPLLSRVKDNAYAQGTDTLNKTFPDSEFEKLYPVVQKALYQFNLGSDTTACTYDQILADITNGTPLVKESIKNISK